MKSASNKGPRFLRLCVCVCRTTLCLKPHRFVFTSKWIDNRLLGGSTTSMEKTQFLNCDLHVHLGERSTQILKATLWTIGHIIHSSDTCPTVQSSVDPASCCSVPLLHICFLSQTVTHLMILPTHSRWLKLADTEKQCHLPSHIRHGSGAWLPHAMASPSGANS